MKGKGRIGAARNDNRKPRLPKDEAKRKREQFIREWAKNNGVSIRVAKAYFEDSE